MLFSFVLVSINVASVSLIVSLYMHIKKILCILLWFSRCDWHSAAAGVQGAMDEQLLRPHAAAHRFLTAGVLPGLCGQLESGTSSL